MSEESNQESSEEINKEENNVEPTEKEAADEITFKDLGLVDILCEACERLKWKEPSKIQRETIPVALSGRDIIGLAETGSGKTGAFALPIIQALLEKQTKLFALILTPTRELAVQISEQFEALGASINLKCAVIIGGVDLNTQKLMLEKRPHIVIATPGRMVDHLKHTKGFNFKTLKYLVIDEADRLLNKDFEKEFDAILSAIPKIRNTYLFSATMTKKVAKLQRASLNNPVKIEVSNKFQTVTKLKQKHLFIPEKFKNIYLVYLLNEIGDKSIIIFCNTCMHVQETTLMLRYLGFSSIPLHGQLSQNQRLGVLNKFKSKEKTILIATDVASRGLDIPHVDVVINLYVPMHSKDYIHRVGRTARAGRDGESFIFVTQYDVMLFLKIEEQLGHEIEQYNPNEDEVMVYMDTVNKAYILAQQELSNQNQREDKKHSSNNRNNNDNNRHNNRNKKRSLKSSSIANEVPMKRFKRKKY